MTPLFYAILFGIIFFIAEVCFLLWIAEKKARTKKVSAAVVTSPNHEILQEDLRKQETGRYLYSDEAAVAIAMRDLDTCDGFIMQNNYAARWTDSDALMQSPQSISPWTQGVGPRASVPNFLLSNTADAVVPKIVAGMTYEDPPFLLRPRPGTSDDTIRAKTAIFSYQLEDMNFPEFIERSIYEEWLMGTMIAKWGWHEETKKYRKFKRKAEPETITSPVGFKTVVHTPDTDAIEFEQVERQTRRPYIELKDLSRATPDPSCKVGDARRAKWVVERNFADWYDLEALRDLPDYTLPAKETLLEFFFRDKKGAPPDNQVMTLPEGMRAYLQHATQQNYPTSADPLRATLMLVERQDESSIIVVLVHGSDCILIRNSENPFAEIAKMAGGTGHTYLSSVWRPLRDSFYGQGNGQILGSRQMVAQGTENLALEVLAYPLNPTFTRLRGWNTLTQQISLGTGDVLEVDGDDVRKGIGILEMPEVPQAAWTTLQFNKAEALESAGANQQTTMGAGGAQGTVTGMRSGTGANLVGSAAASRLDGPVERFIRQVFTPFLFIMDNLNNELLPSQAIREILADRAPDMAAIDHVKFRNAQMSYEVLAGAHLGPKREMQQFLAVIEQIAINPQLLQMASEAGMKFNFVDWFKSFAELSGFKFSQEFFVEMTAEEKQRRDANSPAGVAAQNRQGVQQLQQQKDDAKEKQIFDSALARAGEKATVLQAEHALLGTGNPSQTETVG